MSVVTSIRGNVSALETGVVVDPLPLTSAQRASAHFSAPTARGKTVRVSLPRGTELHDGDVLEFDDGVAVVVVAAAEDLLFVKPAGDGMMWWVACYQLGNLHRPARFLDDGILTPYDPMALNILRGFGVLVERCNRPFVGRRFGAVQSHHHQSDADHHHSRGHGQTG
ncbi:urease accessory protein UreE [Hyphomicrobium sp.]|uniref:urease accessory protein UreE n=1 Tax=Hyphomicrobium sp. TaxID=82 RepID=UPI003F6F1648